MSTNEPFLDHAEVEFGELGTTFLSLFIFRTIILIVTNTKVMVEMTANKIMILQVNYTWQQQFQSSKHSVDTPLSHIAFLIS